MVLALAFVISNPRMTAEGQDRVARAVLWDMDGTLVDSREQHWEAWRRTLEPEGYSVTYAQFRETFGWRNDAILGRWLGGRLSTADVRRIGDAKEALYRDLVAQSGISPLPGAREWVRRLSRRGWRQAVASSAPRANVEVLVKALRLGEHFGALVAAEDVTLGKPEPEVFLTAAAKLHVPPARCVVVEDAAAGIEAARRAGMRSISVGIPGAPDFAPADPVVGSLADLPDDAFDRLVPRSRK